MKRKRRKKVEQAPVESPRQEKKAEAAGSKKYARPYKTWHVIVMCVVVFCVAFMVYANTLKGDFIWDDEYLILNNSQIKSFVHLKNVFKTYVGYGSENINNFYRPIQEISNMIDYFLWGEYPFGYHLTNVLLQALVSVMVFIFILKLSENLMIAGVGALFWAVHPVHTEAVAYIAGRADPLYGLFMLLSVVSFISFARRGGAGRGARVSYVLSIAFFVLSLLSKEVIISMPLLIFLYLFYFLRRTEKDNIFRRLKWSWVPYAAIVVIYAWLRSTVLSFADIAPPSAFNKIPLALRLMTFFRTIIIYVKLLIFPVGLHMERSIAITKSVFHPSALIALIFIAAVIWTAIKTYKHNRLVSFAIVWFFANLLPVSNIVPINSFLAEHWIYIASIGPFMLVGVGVYRLYAGKLAGKRPLRIGLLLALALVLLLYARATVLRNRDWKDEISFFNSTLKYHPKNARLYLNLGNTYYEKGQIENAIEQYRKAIDINKNYAVAFGNIGSAYLHKKQPDKAEEYLEKAIGLKYNYPIAHYNLGIVYFQRRKYGEALKELKVATEQLPQLYQAWNMIGRVYIRMGNKEGAIDAFQRSLAIMPKQPSIERVLKKLHLSGASRQK
ncbi:MAG: tetratricopeptide repeat protein [Candidatus Omnitrophica bacterium]|nr:tetratricopeptide repeat protein [Candidatus Omnitrophota bacterium]